MAIEGTRHLVECHCVLPQFRNANPPIYHKFVVFSTLIDDVVSLKMAQCNNCGILHKVIDICKSEIAHGLEEGKSIRSIEEISLGIPQRLAEFLIQQKVDISIWENIEFLLENKKESEIILGREQKDEVTQLKILHVRDDGTFKIKTEVRQDEMVLE